MKNPLKEKVKANKPVIGTFVEIGHPDITEWLSRLGFDWILLDAEHGPLSFETMQNMMQAMEGTGCVPIVRPQWNDPVQIKTRTGHRGLRRAHSLGEQSSGSRSRGPSLQISAGGTPRLWPAADFDARPRLFQHGERSIIDLGADRNADGAG